MSMKGAMLISSKLLMNSSQFSELLNNCMSSIFIPMIIHLLMMLRQLIRTFTWFILTYSGILSLTSSAFLTWWSDWEMIVQFMMMNLSTFSLEDWSSIEQMIITKWDKYLPL